MGHHVCSYSHAAYLNSPFAILDLSDFSSGQESFLYQLFMEKDDKMPREPSVQDLLDMSFNQSKVKLKEVGHYSSGCDIQLERPATR